MCIVACVIVCYHCVQFKIVQQFCAMRLLYDMIRYREQPHEKYRTNIHREQTYRDHLVGILGQEVKRVTDSTIRNGALLLKTSSIHQTALLMKWQSFGGLPLKVTPADNLNQVEGSPPQII